jgi:hypothetical protein
VRLELKIPIHEVGDACDPRGHGHEPCSCAPRSRPFPQESGPLVRRTLVLVTQPTTQLALPIALSSLVAQLGRVPGASSASRARFLPGYDRRQIE